MVRDTWNTIVINPALTSMFPSAPMFTYTRHRNLANYLCRSSSPGTVTEGPNLTTLTEPPESPSMQPPTLQGLLPALSDLQFIQDPLTQHLN